jgi:hypothetical protein
LPGVLDNFASIQRQDKENGSFDHILVLKAQKEIDQVYDLCALYMVNQQLQKITASGKVSETFKYSPNPITFNTNQIFQACVSHIDKDACNIHVQPECDMKDMEKLTEQLE